MILKVETLGRRNLWSMLVVGCQASGVATSEYGRALVGPYEIQRMFRVQVLSHHCISLARISNCMPLIALLFALRKRMCCAVRRALPTVAWSHKVAAFCALNYLHAVSWRHVAVDSLCLDFAHLLRSNLIRCCGLDKSSSRLSTCFKGLEVNFHCSWGLLD